MATHLSGSAERPSARGWLSLPREEGRPANGQTPLRLPAHPLCGWDFTLYRNLLPLVEVSTRRETVTQEKSAATSENEVDQKEWLKETEL